MMTTESLACAVRTLPGVLECKAQASSELRIRSVQVKEAGRSIETLVCGRQVYIKDAPGTIFAAIGYSVVRGDDVNLALNWLAGLGWTDVLEQKGGKYLDMSPYAVHLRHGIDLVRRYSFGELQLLPEMLNNLTKIWDAYYETYPPQIGNSRLIRDFLITHPDLAKPIIHWYVHRGYRHGAPHWFCWDRKSGDWLWVWGGGEKYKPIGWMEDLTGVAPPTVLLLRFVSDELRIEEPKDVGAPALAEALLTRDQRAVQEVVEAHRGELFGGVEQPRANRPGTLLGYHYSAWAGVAKRLRQIKREDAAEILLLALVGCVEQAIPAEGIAAPWYYDQLAIIYRKRKDYVAEIAILERQLRARPFDQHLRFEIEKARQKSAQHG